MELREELVWGSSRRTGRVACEERSTHFQESLISAPSGELRGTSSMVLSALASWIFSRFSDPARTEILRRSAGTKLARLTPIE